MKKAHKGIATLEIPITWDKWTNERLKHLHPLIRRDYALAVNECYDKGYKVRLTSDGHLRTFTEQDELYGHSRTKLQLKAEGVDPKWAKPNLSWKTNASGGESYHNYGLASDNCIIDGKKAIFNIPQEVADKASAT